MFLHAEKVELYTKLLLKSTYIRWNCRVDNSEFCEGLKGQVVKIMIKGSLRITLMQHTIMQRKL